MERMKMGTSQFAYHLRLHVGMLSALACLSPGKPPAVLSWAAVSCRKPSQGWMFRALSTLTPSSAKKSGRPARSPNTFVGQSLGTAREITHRWEEVGILAVDRPAKSRDSGQRVSIGECRPLTVSADPQGE